MPACSGGREMLYYLHILFVFFLKAYMIHATLFEGRTLELMARKKM